VTACVRAFAAADVFAIETCSHDFCPGPTTNLLPSNWSRPCAFLRPCLAALGLILVIDLPVKASRGKDGPRSRINAQRMLYIRFYHRCRYGTWNMPSSTGYFSRCRLVPRPPRQNLLKSLSWTITSHVSRCSRGQQVVSVCREARMKQYTTWPCFHHQANSTCLSCPNRV
jgi:hypothetical protein